MTLLLMTTSLMTASLEQALAQINRATSAAQMLQAVQAIAQHPEVASAPELVVPPLIRAFGYNQAAVAAAALAGVVAVGPAAVPLLLSHIDPDNYGARAYTMRALGLIGDGRALEVLMAAIATDFAPSVRRAAVRALGSVVPPDQRLARLPLLQQLSQDPDWGVRYATVLTLQAWQPWPVPTDPWSALWQQFADQDPDPLIRLRTTVAP